MKRVGNSGHLKLLFLLLVLIQFCISTNAQEIIQGVVKTEDNIAIPNASIEYLHHTMGCVANKDGKFTIRLIVGDTLYVSSTGYQPFLFPVQPQSSTIEIILPDENAMLKEVVVKNKRSKIISLGYYSIIGMYHAYGGVPSPEGGILVPNEKKLEGYVGGIRIKLSNYKNSIFNLRLRLRLIDTLTGKPSDSTAVFTGEVPAASLSGTTEVVIDGDYIRLPQLGIFVTFEWYATNSLTPHTIGPAVTGHFISGDRTFFENYPLGKNSRWSPPYAWVSPNRKKLAVPNISILVSVPKE